MGQASTQPHADTSTDIPSVSPARRLGAHPEGLCLHLCWSLLPSSQRRGARGGLGGKRAAPPGLGRVVASDTRAVCLLQTPQLSARQRGARGTSHGVQFQNSFRTTFPVFPLRRPQCGGHLSTAVPVTATLFPAARTGVCPGDGHARQKETA